MSSSGKDGKNYHRYTSHHDYELTSVEEERYSEIFAKLDVNGDGRIDVHDLTEALKRMSVPQVLDHAKKFFAHTDPDEVGHIDFATFLHYMTEHEKKLRLLFRQIDTNQDGKIDSNEIIASFHELGIFIDKAEAEKLLKRMDTGGTLNISWDEWHNYLLLHPSSAFTDVLHYWRLAAPIVDTGDVPMVLDDYTEEVITTGKWWRYLVAGGTAGAVSRTCTAPLDRIKVLLQVHANDRNKLGFRSGLQALLQEGGVRGLWRGNGVNVLKVTPEMAIKFMAYEKIKKLLVSENGEVTIAKRFVSGSLAGALSQSAIYPIEVLKTRLALRFTGQYTGILDCATKLLRNEGFYSFYRGYLPNLLGIIPYAGIDLCIYETLKTVYTRRSKNDPGAMVLLTCGTISSSCGQLATYPLALVRTKLQAKATKLKLKGGYDRMSDVFAHTIRTEGFLGLYHGLIPNFMKVAPAVSISYVVYEYSRRALGVSTT